jgi:zona occludens toxin
MITLITGTPGAGKTLYAISKLILPLIGTTVKKTEDNGDQVELPRTVYTNINGLLVDHELIGPGGTWDQDKAKEWQFQPIAEGRGLRDWHQWAKPGSVIVYDEFQKVWPPRANGSPVPPDLQGLDTHRHMGVDFVLITQSPNNHDRHVQGLVGRHLHVRRMGNMGLTVVYEWDHCSRQLLYSKSITKAPWRYDKKVFKLYKSAEVHTKSPRRLPGLLFFILAGLAAFPILGYQFQQRLTGAMSGETTATTTSTTTQAQTTQPGQAIPMPTEPAAYDYTQFVPRVSTIPGSAPAFDHLRHVVNMPRVAGAICNTKRCKCVTEQGTDTGMSDQECRDWMTDTPYDPYTAPPPPAPVQLAQATTPPAHAEAPKLGTLDLKF